MKLLVTLVFVWCFGVLVAHANTTDSGSTPIDVQALDNKRLFFSEDQRQVDNAAKMPVKQSAKSGADPAKLVSDDALRYTGVIHSVRGVQLLLNGYPWLPGQLEITSARLQPETQQIEIQTTNGTIHRLLPGESIEINP